MMIECCECREIFNRHNIIMIGEDNRRFKSYYCKECYKKNKEENE